MTDIDALVERLDSHMGKAEVPDLLRDCRLARDAIKQLQAENRKLQYEVSRASYHCD